MISVHFTSWTCSISSRAQWVKFELRRRPESSGSRFSLPSAQARRGPNRAEISVRCEGRHLSDTHADQMTDSITTV